MRIMPADSQSRQIGLLSLFGTNSDFQEHAGNLYKTRAGLYKIAEQRPDLRESIQGQFDTLNEIVGFLRLEFEEWRPNVPVDFIQDMSSDELEGALNTLLSSLRPLDYHVDNIAGIEAGLRQIVKIRPDLKAAFNPQIQTLERLREVLLSAHKAL